MSVKKIDTRRIYEGRRVHLEVQTVELPGGRRSELEIVRHPGAAAVVPVDENGLVYLVRQYRHATGERLLEVPAGTLDPGETSEQCALREVEEETGRVAGRLEPLGWIWTTPGFTDEKIWLYLATELSTGRQSLDDDELLDVVTMPLADAAAAAASGRLVDGKSVCALLRAIARGS